jgi:hypothetical protein
LEPKNLRFGGGVAETVLNPAVLLFILVAGVLMCVLPRKKAMIPFLVASILIPMDQVLLIGGTHFPMLRVLVLFGAVRIFKDRNTSRYKIFSGGLNKIDVSQMLLTIFTVINGILLFQESGAVVFQLGNLYTIFGIYFLLRFLIRDDDDIVRMIRTLACIAAFIAVIMAWEIQTGHNPYAILGGARAASYATLMERDDRFRALGCFGHPILAGTFGAILVPLFVLLWRKGKRDRVLAGVGIAACTVIVLTSNSSTPVLAYAGGVLAIFLWPMRRWMRVIRWGIVILVVSLHMVMKAPVWHLISRIDISGGSSGYHRYMLIDQCVRHFSDWWLIGVKSTFDWGWDMWDTANQYVSLCDSSGLLPFLLFLATIVYSFKYLGNARKAATDKKKRLFLWSLGACLFANVISFVGISYWDQTQVVWYGLLAAISAAVVIRPDFPNASLKSTLSSDGRSAPQVEVEGDGLETEPSVGTLSESFLAN